MNSALRNLLRSLQLNRPSGTLKMLRAKAIKRKNYPKMLREVGEHAEMATLVGLDLHSELPQLSVTERSSLLASADAMCNDENRFFTFEYRTLGIARPWQYDPIEKKYWPARHYTEQALHANDTPRDVKIVWEINRFKDLPILAEAAALTNDLKYAEEIERRMLSWIEDNPFAHSINWASALEISIRLLSWTASLELLRRAGFVVHENEKIRHSIWSHAMYLAADLSIDKVVRSNHLIGEVAGLFITSTLWRYPDTQEHWSRARVILEREILAQTFRHGSTRESSTWYHRFVTDFFRMAARCAETVGESFSPEYCMRLDKMEDFLRTMRSPDGVLLRFGDGDDGEALFLGDSTASRWEEYLFGIDRTMEAKSESIFPEGGYVSIHVGQSMLAMRTGPFGMGGDGFSSHAHDDLLAPIVFLDGLPVLVDPGTYVYNGAPNERAKYRGAEAHNAIVIGEGTGAIQKLNFGWVKARRDARLIELDAARGSCIAEFGEWPGAHERTIELGSKRVVLIDRLNLSESQMQIVKQVRWYLHLAPEWNIIAIGGDLAKFEHEGRELDIKFEGPFTELVLQETSFSSGYLRQVPASMLRATSNSLRAEFRITIEIA